MHCPRCEDPLIEYSVEGHADSAVVCESCGYAGVSTDHHSERTPAESWDAALHRFEGGRLLDEAQQTARTSGISLPDRNETGRTTIDADRLEETSVSVGHSVDAEPADDVATPDESESTKADTAE